jgi:hypothetical protein
MVTCSNCKKEIDVNPETNGYIYCLECTVKHHSDSFNALKAAAKTVIEDYISIEKPTIEGETALRNLKQLIYGV